MKAKKLDSSTIYTAITNFSSETVVLSIDYRL